MCDVNLQMQKFAGRGLSFINMEQVKKKKGRSNKICLELIWKDVDTRGLNEGILLDEMSREGSFMGSIWHVLLLVHITYLKYLG